MQSNYRPDIDGLRAIAVLSVLLFHAGFEDFGGGFVGVDIFFVISGFLITRLILTDLDRDRFSFVQFYGRRMRRLFPAFFVAVFACFVLSVLLFLPEDLDRVGKSTVFASFSAANFLFWGEAGYFDSDALTKPLLHTWSLSVEEQFYLLWPATLVVLNRFGGERVTLAVLTITSVLSLVIAERWLQVDAPGAFFLLPSRIVEFGIGALMVWAVRRQPRNQLLLEPVFAAGIAAVMYSVLTYSEDTLFPGLTALVPCVGTALLIYAGGARYLGVVLRNRFMVGVGLISYSLYLVHWPVLVFYQYRRLEPLELSDRLLVVAVSFVLATVMYWFVEKPFRLPRGKALRSVTAPRFIGLCAAVAVLLALPAGLAASNSGWPQRYPDAKFIDFDVRTERQATWNAVRRAEAAEFPDGRVGVAILGNSHAKDLFNAIHRQLGAKPRALFFKPYITNSMCRGIRSRDEHFECDFRYGKFFENSDLQKIEWVVLAPSWREKRVAELPLVLDRLRALGKKVVVFGNTAEFFDVPRAAAILSIRGRSEREIAKAMSRT